MSSPEINPWICYNDDKNNNNIWLTYCCNNSVVYNLVSNLSKILLTVSDWLKAKKNSCQCEKKEYDMVSQKPCVGLDFVHRIQLGTNWWRYRNKILGLILDNGVAWKSLIHYVNDDTILLSVYLSIFYLLCSSFGTNVSKEKNDWLVFIHQSIWNLYFSDIYPDIYWFSWLHHLIAPLALIHPL